MTSKKKYHAILAVGIFIVAIIAGGIGYGLAKLSSPAGSQRILNATIVIHYKDGSSQVLHQQSFLSWFSPQSIEYQGKQISSIEVIPQLTLSWVGELQSISVHVSASFKLGNSRMISNVPPQSWPSVGSNFSYSQDVKLSEFNKVGQNSGHSYGIVNLKPIVLKASQIESWVKQSFGSNYYGKFALAFIVSADITGYFVQGTTDHVSATGYGAITLTRKDPGHFQGASLVLNFHDSKIVHSSPSPGYGGSPRHGGVYMTNRFLVPSVAEGS